VSADTEASIARFRELLQIPTVSHADERLMDADAFTRFIDTLARLYPTAHAARA
jgi:carboxypeptidase PM20D1